MYLSLTADNFLCSKHSQQYDCISEELYLLLNEYAQKNNLSFKARESTKMDPGNITQWVFQHLHTCLFFWFTMSCWEKTEKYSTF